VFIVRAIVGLDKERYLGFAFRVGVSASWRYISAHYTQRGLQIGL
jgi:hypothetical protein